MEVLRKVMNNLIEHPENEKFKAIRLSNEAISKTIGSSKSAINLLFLVGFESKGEGLMFADKKYNKNLLKQAAKAIGDIVTTQEEENQVQSLDGFDPYKSVSVGAVELNKAESEEYRVDFMKRAIETEKERRVKAAQTPIKDRELQIFKIKPNEKLCTATRTVIALDMEMSLQEASDAHMDEAQTYLKLKRENEEAQMFKYRALRELQGLRKTPVYTKGYIKLKFPDMYVLQAAFSPSETAEFVYSFIREVILAIYL
eukprot:TRINITY_DN2904_c0_g1_i11.p1 TRINITY_DN2904_c0_g1~~TRINITY_DN2904_c0_g1_i11.p1  ORF type:complete len:257 (+),score=85.52 TRINITY_DN2904_c0_g1_i11:1078-1848(+)